VLVVGCAPAGRLAGRLPRRALRRAGPAAGAAGRSGAISRRRRAAGPGPGRRRRPLRCRTWVVWKRLPLSSSSSTFSPSSPLRASLRMYVCAARGRAAVGGPAAAQQPGGARRGSDGRSPWRSGRTRWPPAGPGAAASGRRPLPPRRRTTCAASPSCQAGPGAGISRWGAARGPGERRAARPVRRSAGAMRGVVPRPAIGCGARLRSGAQGCARRRRWRSSERAPITPPPHLRGLWGNAPAMRRALEPFLRSRLHGRERRGRALIIHEGADRPPPQPLAAHRPSPLFAFCSDPLAAARHY
jgi:hypothetical protein